MSESGLLLLEELLDEAGVLSQTEEDPSDGRGGRVLTSHQERNHDTSDLVLRDLFPILVLAVQQVPYHIVLALLPLGLAIPSPANDIGVQLDHSLTCVVTRTVVGKRGPGEHEVDGREAHVKIVVQFGKARVEGVTDLLALKRAGGSVDGELSHDLGDIEGALLTLEGLVALDEVLGFFGDDGNVGAKSVLGKTKLDKLGRKLAVCNARREPVYAYLLLLHQLGIGAVVYNILAKYRSGEGAVDLLGVDILDLSVENEVVALGTKVDSHLATEKNEGEYIAILPPVSVFPSWPLGTRHTFFCWAKKNLYGSMPYVTVLPMIGNKWKTTGGSLGFLSSNCWRTLRTTASTRKAAKPAAIVTGVDELAVKLPIGPEISARTPMLRDEGG